jgi:hypothetical protein
MSKYRVYIRCVYEELHIVETENEQDALSVAENEFATAIGDCGIQFACSLEKDTWRVEKIE